MDLNIQINNDIVDQEGRVQNPLVKRMKKEFILGLTSELQSDEL